MKETALFYFEPSKTWLSTGMRGMESINQSISQEAHGKCGGAGVMHSSGGKIS